MTPVTIGSDYEWAAYLATGLALVMYAQTLDEAKLVAQTRLLEIAENERAQIPAVWKLRWQKAALEGRNL